MAHRLRSTYRMTAASGLEARRFHNGPAANGRRKHRMLTT